MTALLTAVFTLGVLAGLALAVFLSTAAERRWFSCLWGRLRVSTRRAPKVPAPMPLQEAWAEQERLQGLYPPSQCFSQRPLWDGSKTEDDQLDRQLCEVGLPRDPNDFMRPANPPDWE
jgi:hypothetical protein